jgi:hypothetical protein
LPIAAGVEMPIALERIHAADGAHATRLHYNVIQNWTSPRADRFPAVAEYGEDEIRFTLRLAIPSMTNKWSTVGRTDDGRAECAAILPWHEGGSEAG